EYFNQNFQLNIYRTTVSKIINEKDKQLAVVPNELAKNKFCYHSPKFLLLEKAMSLWIEKAKSASLDTLFEEKQKLNNLLSQYTLDQIYNADKTALYYCMQPNQTLLSASIM
ncbi:10545_t:CDS:2, partial [Dentiscutata heterogama]